MNESGLRMNSEGTNSCAVCGDVIDAGEDLCIVCAQNSTAVTKMLICPHCHTSTPAAYPHCVQCRVPLTVGAGESMRHAKGAVPQESPPPPPPRVGSNPPPLVTDSIAPPPPFRDSVPPPPPPPLSESYPPPPQSDSQMPPYGDSYPPPSLFDSSLPPPPPSSVSSVPPLMDSVFPTLEGSNAPRPLTRSAPTLPSLDSTPPPTVTLMESDMPPPLTDDHQSFLDSIPPPARSENMWQADGRSAPSQPAHKLPSTPPSSASYIRQIELQILVKRFTTCMKQRTVGGAIVTGANGMGVSTLLKRMAAQIAKRLPENQVYFVVCRELDDPFFPFSHILKQAFGVHETVDPSEARARIAAIISSMLGDESPSAAEETTHLLGYVAGVPFPQSPILRALQRDPELLYDRLKEALVRYIFFAFNSAPSVLIYDDVHQLPKNARSRHLLIDVLRELRDVPFFVVLGGGLELSNLMDSSRFPIISLTPHDEATMRVLFFEMMPRLTNPPEKLVSATVKRAAGNPGALYDLCLLLRDSGAINMEADEWTVDLSRLNLPTGKHDALRARFEQLDPRDKLVLQTASVFGDTFWDEVVVVMSRVSIRLKESIDAGQIWADDSDGLAISSSLARLVERKFLVQVSEREADGTSKYAFARSGMREKIVATIDRKREKQYHFLAAEWLHHSAMKYGRITAEMEANHWLAGGDPHRAAAAYFRAARQAHSRYSNQKAIELFTKGLELASEDDRLLRIDAFHDLGSLYELQGKMHDSEWCFTEMLRNAWILGHRGKAGAALNKVGRLYRARGDGAAARAFFNRSMTLFKAAGDEIGMAACLGDLGELARQEGSFDRAYKLVREAFEIQRKHGNRRSMAVSLQCLGKIEAARTSFDRAERYFLEALEMLRKINDRGGMAQTLSALAMTMFNREDLEGAVKRFEASLELAREVGDRRMQGIAHNHLGEVHREQRKYKESMAHFKACEEIAISQNERMLHAEVLRNLAILEMKMGDIELGRQHALESLELAKQIGGKEVEALAYRAIGELNATTMWDTSNTTGVDEALVSFDKALDIFRTIGNEFEVAKTLHVMGNRMLERGDMAGSRKLLKEAKQIFERVNAKISDRIERTISETSDHSQAIPIGVSGKR